MLKFTVTCENGRAESRTEGSMVTRGEALGFFKSVGVSLGRFLTSLPGSMPLEAIDALMAGLEEAKQECDN